VAPARRCAESQDERRQRRDGERCTLQSVFHVMPPKVEFPVLPDGR
jgi:hypothetical protein